MTEKNILSWLDVNATHFHTGEDVSAEWYCGEPFLPSEFTLGEISAVVSGPSGNFEAAIAEEGDIAKVSFSPGDDGFYHLLCRGKYQGKTFSAQRLIAVGHFHEARSASTPAQGIFKPVYDWQEWHRGEQIDFEMAQPGLEPFLYLQGPEGVQQKRLSGNPKVNIGLEVPGKYIAAAKNDALTSTISFWVLK